MSLMDAAPDLNLPEDTDAELLALLTLRFTPALGPRRIENLRRHFGSAQAVLGASLTQLRAVPGLDTKSLSAIGAAGVGVRAQQELSRAREAGVQVLGRGLEGYPAALEALQDPPAALWVRGADLPQEVVPRAVGIVGTRAASDHALKFTRQLSGDLARAGVNVVSGLARGIDSAAHQAALDAGGVSTALLGCGVDVIYPAENARLAARLTLVSEYPMGTRPATHHFPQRNRLIAALSAGSVVIEGDLKSGAMITATHALECGRSAFAVPGRAGDPLAAGPHRLLREGAVLTENVSDVLHELGWGEAPAPVHLDMSPEQALVYAALPETGAVLLDDVVSRSGLNISEAQLALTMLGLCGLVDERGGRYLRR
ncbi:DNA-protecting protein DprA [Deinococcus psychrotolerans]|uniref:DNA-protecting protein DprA n=1 Tax=Deinococcus psychrotolerans TaxID=2489213 RepID=A0A3G8YDH1_9DEIO|nr:DNA-processing protein DprA [Deinococcus psychrotolerans]AZI42963.1 DNA-protecting protein DprA [Deinococcus psychrotolerans]